MFYSQLGTIYWGSIENTSSPPELSEYTSGSKQLSKKSYLDSDFKTYFTTGCPNKHGNLETTWISSLISNNW